MYSAVKIEKLGSYGVSEPQPHGEQKDFIDFSLPPSDWCAVQAKTNKHNMEQGIFKIVTTIKDEGLELYMARYNGYSTVSLSKESAMEDIGILITRNPGGPVSQIAPEAQIALTTVEHERLNYIREYSQLTPA